jgi:hypothetical protein
MHAGRANLAVLPFMSTVATVLLKEAASIPTVCYPLLSTGRIGYAMKMRGAQVEISAGLRGAVSINIMLSTTTISHSKCTASIWDFVFKLPDGAAHCTVFTVGWRGHVAVHPV